MIETTGQTARITRSIIAGQPRAVDTVAAVSAHDGERWSILTGATVGMV